MGLACGSRRHYVAGPEGAVVAAVGLLALLGCGTTVRDVSGAWAGNDPHQHSTAFEYVGLVLQQNGPTLTGTACFSDSGVEIFSGVPVQGAYPDVMFTVQAANVRPCCMQFVGATFHGSFNEAGTVLTGHFGQSTAVEFTLQRTLNSSC